MNRDTKLDTRKIKLAGMRYYDDSHNGVEVGNDLSYAFLYQLEDDTYINIFNPLETYPIFRRLPYANCLNNGESYGNMLGLVGNKLQCSSTQTGPCYIIFHDSNQPKFESQEITYSELEEMMLESPMYFVDRANVIAEHLGVGIKDKNYKNILKRDAVCKKSLNDFIESRRIGIQKVKE